MGIREKQEQVSVVLIILSAVALLGVILLARAEAALPADTPRADADLDGGDPRPIAPANVQRELLRFVAMALAVIAGGGAAVEVARLNPAFILTPLVALLVCAVVATALMGFARGAVSEVASAPQAGTPIPNGMAARLGGAVRAVGRVGAALASVARTPNETEAEEEASEQFSQVLSSEAEMSQDEEKLLRGAISLPRITVRDVMVPRVAVLGVEVGTPWSEMLDRLRSAQHSRLPAFRRSLDDVVGVLVAKDVLPFAVQETQPPRGWEQLLRPVSFVPATKAVGDQLRDFRQSRTHIAVVVDEYGGSAGILTIEDVLEELVGEIRDEHDVEEAPIVSEGGTRFWVSGRLSISQLEEITGESLDHGLAVSVGGFVFERIGRVPKVGESIVWGNFRAVVERMRRYAVDRVYLERIERRPTQTRDGQAEGGKR